MIVRAPGADADGGLAAAKDPCKTPRKGFESRQGRA